MCVCCHVCVLYGWACANDDVCIHICAYANDDVCIHICACANDVYRHVQLMGYIVIFVYD